jgi:hypothetical protein
VGARANALDARAVIPELRIACTSFLLAVLVGDLTFDPPVLRATETASVANTLDAASRYYLRVTSRFSPLSVAVAVAMAALVAVIVRDVASAPCAACSALVGALALLPIAIALLRTFPNAKRFASGEGAPAARAGLARSIARDHLLALASMAAYLSARIAGYGG